MAPHRWLCIAVALCLPLPLGAGPWPQKPGEALVISSLESGRHIGHWAEYGLSPRRWLSLELDFPPDGGMMEAALSLHQALPDHRGWKSALSFGLAFRSPDPTSEGFHPEPGFQLGGALGRGFETPLPGWLALAARYREGRAFRWIKAEATLGLRPADRLSLIGQLQFSVEEEAPRRLKIQGAGLWQLTPKLGLEFGLSRNLWGEDRSPTARIASWLRF